MSHTTGTWRDTILKEFPPQIARLTLVADPDELLVEAGIQAALQQRGFDLLSYDDHGTFRYAYESQYRLHWDAGVHSCLIVRVSKHATALPLLPYDLVQAGRLLSFTLGDLFPNLSYPVIAALDRSDLDALYQAQTFTNPDRSGDKATRDFVLRHVFEIAPESILQPADLLRVLLRRHYRGQRIPLILDERLIEVVAQRAHVADWPLEQIIPDRDAFLHFLQERWPIFLERMAGQPARPMHELREAYNVQSPGPLDVPFQDDDVRAYIDTLFLEGMLRPVVHAQSAALTSHWVAVGIQTDPHTDRLHRLDGLLTRVETNLPPPDARHQEWLAFAYRWAELGVLWHQTHMDAPPEWVERLHTLQDTVDQSFQAWMQQRYSALHNQPACPPVMVHHLPRTLARHHEQTGHQRTALIVLDGLALDQWIILRDVLAHHQPAVTVREEAVFAWVPTITSVSRQAIFAGKPPIYYPGSILTTSKEPVLWRQFWSDRGVNPTEVAYTNVTGDDADMSTIEQILSYPRVRILGLVITKIDDIMHGMQLGTAGMHNQVRQWTEHGFLVRLLDQLAAHHFAVFLTSDHGNIAAVGWGRPAEGALAERRGERVRIYTDPILRTRVNASFPDAIAWPPMSLPATCLPLLAPARKAFSNTGDHIVSHGGATLEEVIVPWIQIQGNGV